MPRPTKQRRIQFDIETINEMAKEIYNDTHNIRNKIARVMTKWETSSREPAEIAQIGDTFVKLVMAELKNYEIKVKLLGVVKDGVMDMKNMEFEKEMIAEKEKQKALATASIEKLAAIKAKELKNEKSKENVIIPEVIDRDRRNEIIKMSQNNKKN